MRYKDEQQNIGTVPVPTGIIKLIIPLTFSYNIPVPYG
jgi:hypothetical protein